MRVGVIGSGVSGIAAARVLSQLGHEVIVFERSGSIGGVWATAYPEVRLQNVVEQYRLADFPFPFPVSPHPTAAEIMRYLEAAVANAGTEVRLNHDVAAMEVLPAGWLVRLRTPGGEVEEKFDHVVIAVGLYGDGKIEMPLPGRERFAGSIVAERDIVDLEIFRDRAVAVVGFGKTALDLATFAVAHGGRVTHIFRAARWLLPRVMFGRPTAAFATSRAATFVIPSWLHFRRLEAMAHRWLALNIWLYWKVTEWILAWSAGMHPFHRDPAARRRLREVTPHQPLTYHLRSAAALAPDAYYGLVREGAIEPRRATVASLTESSVVLDDQRSVPADVLVLAVGNHGPAFPFLPEPCRAVMTGVAGGTQLYRHIIHPRIPRLAFAGFNHTSLHTASVQVAMLWYGAVMEGRIELPSPETMEASAARVTAWKQRHSLFEATRAYGVGNRIHNYLDVLLTELELDPHRKQGWLADWFAPYLAKDYANATAEYLATRATGVGPRMVLPLDT